MADETKLIDLLTQRDAAKLRSAAAVLRVIGCEHLAYQVEQAAEGLTRGLKDRAKTPRPVIAPQPQPGASGIDWSQF